MDFFIKKIFERNADDLVHLQFQKFSRGKFRNRAMIRAKSSKKKFSIKTSAEYANELVRYFAEKLGDRTTDVNGVVVSTKDLEGELDFKNKKQFMGIKQYVIEKEMRGNEIIELCDKFSKAFIGFSFKVDDSELKIKPKSPKSAKPSTKEEEKPKIDFCKLKTSDLKIVQGLIFDEDAESFKEIEISHDFLIDEIVMPENEKDINKIRELAKRKGRIIRKLIVDGKQSKN